MRIFLCLLALSLCVSGCFPARRCVRPPYEVACTDFDQSVNEAICSTSFAAESLPCYGWWRMFEDEQLECLIETALGCNPDMRIAETRIQRAIDESVKTRALLFPYLQFDAGVWRHRVSQFASLPPPELGIFSEAQLNFSATYEIDLWKKNRSLFQASIDEVRAARADAQEAALILSAMVAQTYFDLQANLAHLAIAEKLLLDRKDTYTLLLQKFNRGVISEFRLYETDTQVAEVEDLIEMLKGEIEVNHHALAALVGTGGESVLVCQPSACFQGPFPMPACLPLDLIARRPEISAQIARIRAAGCRAYAAEAAFYPNINLMGFLGLKGIRFSKLFQAQSLDILGKAALSLPIFTGGELTAELNITRDEFEIANEAYNSLILAAVQEVSDWITALVTADRREEKIIRSIKDARNLERLTCERYKKGMGNYLSVLNAYEDVLLQEDLKVDIELARYQAVVGLIKSLGGGYYDGCN